MVPRARLGAALAASLLTLGLPRAAHAWVEAHVESDDVRVSVERSGDARVEHKITLKVAGGPLRALDIRGVDADATPDPDGYVAPQKESLKGSLASAQPIAAERMPPELKPRTDGSPAPHVLRLRFDPDRGLGRGVYVILIRYTTRLTSRITKEGALSKLTWRGPTWDDGFDSARVTFELPAAPTAPRADEATAAEPGDRAPLVLSTVRRGTAKDFIELLRPYAPKGEPITWAIKADTRAFQAPKPAAAPPAAGLDGVLGDAARRAVLGAGALSLFLLYASLVALKASEVRRRAAALRPLVPLPAAVRAILAGAALTAGAFTQVVLMRATLGSLLVLTAAALAAHRGPRADRAPLRGPGRWLPVTESAALRDPPRLAGTWLDASTRAGKLLLLLSSALVVGGAALLFETSPFRAELVALDVVALFAVFGTGRLAQLAPDPAVAPARFFRDVARRVRKQVPDVRVVGRIRVPDGRAEPDELRLALAPRAAPAGFGGLEVGVVYVSGAGGVFAVPELILRVTSDSACEEALASLIRHGRAARGRKPGERAVIFTPRLPDARTTAAIAVRLSRAMAAARAPRPSAARRAA
jgi:hypothetical protein